MMTGQFQTLGFKKYSNHVTHLYGYSMYSIYLHRFGFVDFDSAKDAQDAFNAMDGQEIDGRQVFLDFAEERRGKLV